MPDVPMFHIYACLAHLTTEDDCPELQRHLVLYLSDWSSDSTRVEQLVTALLSRRYANTHFSLRRASADPLLAAALCHCALADRGVELFFGKLRRTLLTFALIHQCEPTLEALAGAVAQRAHNTEYITWHTDSEQEITESLLHTVEYHLASEQWTLADIYRPLPLLAMYRPLRELPHAKKLAEMSTDQWPAALATLAHESLTAARVERELVSTICHLGPPPGPDQVYTGQAYPRWQRLPRTVRRSSYLARYPQLRVALPECVQDASPLEVLVAGCGSGLEALLASQALTDVRVTGLDGALHNLTFARRKAVQYQIENVELVLGTLAETQRMSTRYHVIECSKLLERESDTRAGLETLLRLLEPGGLLRLRLPSRLANEALDSFRDTHVPEGYVDSDQGLRSVRHTLLSTHANLEGWPALYSMHACRDLLLDDSKRFDLVEVKALLSHFNLRFGGFVFGQRDTVEAYQRQYPGDPLMLNLDNWHAFELLQPGTFRHGYDFHCQPAY